VWTRCGWCWNDPLVQAAQVQALRDYVGRRRLRAHAEARPAERDAWPRGGQGITASRCAGNAARLLEADESSDTPREAGDQPAISASSGLPRQVKVPSPPLRREAVCHRFAHHASVGRRAGACHHAVSMIRVSLRGLADDDRCKHFRRRILRSARRARRAPKFFLRMQQPQLGCAGVAFLDYARTSFMVGALAVRIVDELSRIGRDSGLTRWRHHRQSNGHVLLPFIRTVVVVS